MSGLEFPTHISQQLVIFYFEEQQDFLLNRKLITISFSEILMARLTGKYNKAKTSYGVLKIPSFSLDFE